MASDKERIAQLEGELVALNAKLSSLLAMGSLSVVQKTPAELEAERVKAGQAKKRALLKAATAKQGGMAYYRIPMKYYRAGVLFEAGHVVAIPESEEPSYTWHPVTPAEARVEEPAAASPPLVVDDETDDLRPSDTEVA